LDECAGEVYSTNASVMMDMISDESGRWSFLNSVEEVFCKEGEDEEQEEEEEEEEGRDKPES
jgi:hypothetical protein